MDEGGDLRLSEVLAALSYALDITEGQPAGHAVRTCLIGMRLAEEVGLEIDDRAALFYALLLKDAGCSSNAAKISSLFGADDLAPSETSRRSTTPTCRRRSATSSETPAASATSCGCSERAPGPPGR